MNLLKAHQKLLELSPSFSTREAAKLLEISSNHATTLLTRLTKENSIVHLARGRWVHANTIDPLLLPNILVEPMMAYISLYSALYYHGMIEQIPSTIFAISTGKTKLFNTPLARVSIHSINPKLFTGYEIYGKNSILMATPEKALFDTLYLIPAKSNLFKRLTEIELPKNFQLDLFELWYSKIQNEKRIQAIKDNLKSCINHGF